MEQNGCSMDIYQQHWRYSCLMVAYKDHAAIISPNHMESIKAANAFYNQMNVAKRDSVEQKQVEKEYQKVIGMLMEKVISVQKNLLDKKKMIVFVINWAKAHWEATFVFNPSYIYGLIRPLILMLYKVLLFSLLRRTQGRHNKYSWVP
jgi:hypothetical protein